MNNYRNRPKGNYIHEATWQDLYILTESWKNDLEQYLLEINFLESLINTCFAKLLLYEKLDDLRKLQMDITVSKDQCINILQRIPNNLSNIVELIDKPCGYQTILFRVEHEQFEDKISDFIEMVKFIRQTVFSKTKGVFENEKPKYSWNLN